MLGISSILKLLFWFSSHPFLMNDLKLILRISLNVALEALVCWPVGEANMAKILEEEK